MVDVEPLSRRLAWYLLVLAVAAYMLLSGQVLLRLGIPYDASYGPPIAKLHPGTYCLMLAWFLATLSHGNPVRVFAGQIARHRLLATYFACMVVVFVWVLLRHGASGAAFIIESLWTPAIAAFVLYLLNQSRHRQIVQIIMVLLVCNAALALLEAFFRMRLVPLPPAIADSFSEPHFRASALLGHPLHNTMITVSLLPAVSLLPWPLAQRLFVALLLALAILAFGGRAGLFLGGLFYGAYVVFMGAAGIVRGRFSYLQLTGGSLAVMLGVTGLVGLVAGSGLGARIFENMKMDSSAAVRLRVWDAFNYLSDDDFWLGIAPTQIDHISLRMGLDPLYEAIENFWIYLFMQFGIIGFVPFLIGLVCLLVVLWKAANSPMRVAVLVYFLVASAANTLAAKTMSLLLLTVVVVAGEVFRCRPSPANCAISHPPELSTPMPGDVR
jgi:O-antigen ligase